MSERSGGTDAPPSPTPTDGSGDDIYAAAAASSAGRSRASTARRPSVKPVKQSAAEPDSPSSDASTSKTATGGAAAAGGAAGATSAGGGASTSGAGSASRTADTASGSSSADSSQESTTTTATAARARTSESDARSDDADGKTEVIPAGHSEGEESAAAAEAKPEKRKVASPRSNRRARLRLSRVDPWSVMKTAFMFSIAAGIVLVVAVYAVWLVIGSSGLFESIDSIVGSVLQSPSDTTPFRIGDYINTQKVMGVTAFLACVDVVIFTALATLASFLYNLAAVMLGGLEVTLAED